MGNAFCLHGIRRSFHNTPYVRQHLRYFLLSAPSLCVSGDASQSQKQDRSSAGVTNTGFVETRPTFAHRCRSKDTCLPANHSHPMPKARLEHVPILYAQIGDQKRVEGVRIEVRSVAVLFTGVEVIRAPDQGSILSNAYQARHRTRCIEF